MRLLDSFPGVFYKNRLCDIEGATIISILHLVKQYSIEASMRFATYLPYDWKETARCFIDYCSEHIGKDSVYCIPADTPEDFLSGSICIEPTCPELLIVFEVKHFYWIDKITHYKFLTTGDFSEVYSSRFITDMLSNSGKLMPYKEFVDYYRDLNKTHLEILVPKEEIMPMQVVDIQKAVEEAFIEAQLAFETPKQAFINEQINDDQEFFKDVGDMPRERCLRNLAAKFYFQNFITNDILTKTANEIYGSNISYTDIDLDVFWKLKDKFNESPSKKRLSKLIKYFQSFIQYK